MARLLLFNPEHDYALAHGGPYYMPPVSVRNIALHLQFIPLIWSRKGDFILGADNEIFNSEDLSQISLNECYPFIDKIIPWGWDAATRFRLESIGFAKSLLPGLDFLDMVRRLSHRRISIKCNEYLDSPLIPKEIFNVNEAEEFVASHPGCYFKLPWSSGGRGVLATAELNSDQIREWILGALRRQGSVMAEPFINRVIDFSSLWKISESQTFFEGLSISLSDGRGKYKGNLFGPQVEIFNYVKKNCDKKISPILKRQKEFIGQYISPYYQGEMGIDMIIGQDKEIYPCVEINLRRTMGHVALNYNKFLKTGKILPLKMSLPLINIKTVGL